MPTTEQELQQAVYMQDMGKRDWSWMTPEYRHAVNCTDSECFICFPEDLDRNR